MTEISFLLSLVLDHKLPKQVQILIKDRIKEIETNPSRPVVQAQIQRMHPVVGNQQSPSTQAIMDANPDLVQVMPPIAVKRIIGGEVTTGSSSTGLSGTKGPRKF